MVKLDKSLYDNSEIIGKYLYCKQKTKDAYLYNIFVVDNILKDKYTNQITYQVNRYYMLFVPYIEPRKVFIYDTYKTIELKNCDIIYEMSNSEYINTFRCFLKYEGKLNTELPDKIIQDNI